MLSGGFSHWFLTLRRAAGGTSRYLLPGGCSLVLYVLPWSLYDFAEGQYGILGCRGRDV